MSVCKSAAGAPNVAASGICGRPADECMASAICFAVIMGLTAEAAAVGSDAVAAFASTTSVAIAEARRIGGRVYVWV